MKPYIFNYSESIKIKESYSAYDNLSQINFPQEGNKSSAYIGSRSSGTRITETIESTDEDHMFSLDSTLITNVIENTDHDEFFRSSTMITRCIENDDPDELCLIDLDANVIKIENSLSDKDTTIVTKSLEPSDDEYFPN